QQLVWITSWMEYTTQVRHPDQRILRQSLINLLLVICRIRTGWLIQSVDYVAEGDQLLFYIVRTHSNLRIQNIDQGVLIMRHDTKIELGMPYTETELGNLLNYPYAGDITSNRKYYYKILIHHGHCTWTLIGMIAGNRDSPSAIRLEDRLRRFFRLAYRVSGCKFGLYKVSSVYLNISDQFAKSLK